MNIIVITGASSGLGKEFAIQLDKIFTNIDEIWLIARRRDRMEKLAEQLNAKTRILPIDLTKDFEIRAYEHLLDEIKPNVKMLINCAGYGVMGAFTDNSLNEQIGMLDINCVALTKISYMSIPYMKKNARIIQLASSAGFLPQANFAVYAASKSYVLSFSMALNQELRDRNIYVTAVCPGPVNTEFFDIAEKNGKTLAIKKLTIVEADKVVTAAIFDSLHKKAKSVYSLPIKAFHIMTKIFPQDFILAVMRYMK